MCPSAVNGRKLPLDTFLGDKRRFHSILVLQMELRMTQCFLLLVSLRGIVSVLLNKYYIYGFILIIGQKDDVYWSFDCYAMRDGHFINNTLGGSTAEWMMQSQ
jgi:hypothetical protein